MEKRVGFSVIVGGLLVLPFLIMEWLTNSAAPRSNFSGIWFVALWIAAAVFLFLLVPMVQSIRAGHSVLAHPLPTLLMVGLLAFIAWNWVALVHDQWLCFLGATGC